MAGPYGGPQTEQERFLRDSLGSITGSFAQLQDASAVSNGWQTMELFSATVTTNTTVTGATINVKASSSQTIIVDLTGTNTGGTGVVLTLRAGLSGFAFVTLRAFTATILSAEAWKVATAGNVTGATAGTTGITRYDDMFLQVSNPATATGGSVTVKARVFTSPEF
mgnify:CR=1 FL=1